MAKVAEMTRIGPGNIVPGRAGRAIGTAPGRAGILQDGGSIDATDHDAGPGRLPGIRGPLRARGTSAIGPESGRDWVASRLGDPPAAPSRAEVAIDAGRLGLRGDLGLRWPPRLLGRPAGHPGSKRPRRLMPINRPRPSCRGAPLGRGAGDRASIEVSPRPRPRSPRSNPTTKVRADRLAEAVRLTREAAQAWASVLQDAPEDVGTTR